MRGEGSGQVTGEKTNQRLQTCRQIECLLRLDIEVLFMDSLPRLRPGQTSPSQQQSRKNCKKKKLQPVVTGILKLDQLDQLDQLDPVNVVSCDFVAELWCGVY